MLTQIGDGVLKTRRTQEINNIKVGIIEEPPLFDPPHVSPTTNTVRWANRKEAAAGCNPRILLVGDGNSMVGVNEGKLNEGRKDC
jgi:hypothetical protein